MTLADGPLLWGTTILICCVYDLHFHNAIGCLTISTFYAQFSLNPKGENQISVCLGTACYVKGSGQVLERIEKELNIATGQCTSDGKFSLDACRCVGACGLAPVMIVNGDVYGRMTPDQVPGILAKYK